MRKPVTTDTAVLQGWPKKGTSHTSAEVAAALSLTVFQITARLKGMAGRGFVQQGADKKWSRTEAGTAEAKNPSPSVAKVSRRMTVSAEDGVVGPPDDSNVPTLRIGKGDWAPPAHAVREAESELPKIEKRLTEFKEDPARYRREIMCMTTERDHWRGVIKRSAGKKWSHRTENTTHLVMNVYVAPDRREYVPAKSFESADLIVLAPPGGAGPTRLRLYSTSSVAKKRAKVEREKTKREESKKEQAQQERAKRVLAAELEETTDEEARPEKESFPTTYISHKTGSSKKGAGKTGARAGVDRPTKLRGAKPLPQKRGGNKAPGRKKVR